MDRGAHRQRHRSLHVGHDGDGARPRAHKTPTQAHVATCASPTPSWAAARRGASGSSCVPCRPTFSSSVSARTPATPRTPVVVTWHGRRGCCVAVADGAGAIDAVAAPEAGSGACFKSAGKWRTLFDVDSPDSCQSHGARCSSHRSSVEDASGPVSSAALNRGCRCSACARGGTPFAGASWWRRCIRRPRRASGSRRCSPTGSTPCCACSSPRRLAATTPPLAPSLAAAGGAAAIGLASCRSLRRQERCVLRGGAAAEGIERLLLAELQLLLLWTRLGTTVLIAHAGGQGGGADTLAAVRAEL
eukprot:scaffold431_cov315-Prasinococcus_capsulatus_cf.AAC.6